MMERMEWMEWCNKKTWGGEQTDPNNVLSLFGFVWSAIIDDSN